MYFLVCLHYLYTRKHIIIRYIMYLNDPMYSEETCFLLPLCVIVSILLFVHDSIATTSTQDTYLQDFLEVL